MAWRQMRKSSEMGTRLGPEAGLISASNLFGKQIAVELCK